MSDEKYVLITPAYNAEADIEKTITSVVNQTLLPQAWVIVNDGSTDKTGETIASYAERYSFIRHVEVVKDITDIGHCFGSKVRAINRGIDILSKESYQFIGILDADVSFIADYFEILISKFREAPRLGVAGGNIVQYFNGKYEKRIKEPDSVAGAVQFFSRECYESTVGFLELEYGGEDAIIETHARMNGYEVKTFFDLEVIHYGIVGQASGSRIKARFEWGQMNYLVGYHALFEFMRCLYRTAERPYMIGSIVEFSGYVFAKLRHQSPRAPYEVVGFLRKEQILKIKNVPRRLFRFLGKQVNSI